MRSLPCFLAILWLLAAVVFGAETSPFHRRGTENPPESGTGFTRKAALWIQKTQQELRQALARQLQEEGDEGGLRILVMLLGFSFLYGVVHAIGPGHGKSVIMSAILADHRSTILRSLGLGFTVAFGEALSAIGIVYAIYFFSWGRINRGFGIAEERIRLVSYGIILGLGVLLTIFRLRKHWRVFRRKPEVKPIVVEAGPNQLAIALALGMIPCPGVMILLVFFLTMKLPGLGVLLAFSMALGMATTISAAGILVAVSKMRLAATIEGHRECMQRIEALLEISGAFLIVWLAWVMLF